jgi:tetratricopeptide (TPR) repeat protein
VQRHENEVALMLEAGYVLRYAHRYNEAREIFYATRALLPRNEVSDLALAGVFLDEGKYEEAMAHCQRALNLNSSSAPTYIQLAEIHLSQGDYTRAKRNLQRARELAPKGPIAELTKAFMKLVSVAGPKTQPARVIST